MIHLEDPTISEAIGHKLLYTFRQYTKSRRNDVARGAETPELAALLIEKYGEGMIKAAQIAELDARDLQKEADGAVLAVDPDFEENRKRRWAACPAGLSFADSNS